MSASAASKIERAFQAGALQRHDRELLLANLHGERIDAPTELVRAVAIEALSEAGIAGIEVRPAEKRGSERPLTARKAETPKTASSRRAGRGSQRAAASKTAEERRIAPNTRKRAILSAAVAGAPAVHVSRSDDERLPALRRPGPIQGTLPFVPETPDHVLPVFVHRRDVLDSGGNGPVPVAWRFFYEVLLSAPIAAYGDRSALLTPTVADLIEFAGWKRFERTKHVPAMNTALDSLYDVKIPYRGRHWRPLVVRDADLPVDVDLRERIGFDLRLPGGTRQGPQIDRQVLRSLAPKSFPRYRGLLALAAYWDRYGRGRGGMDAVASSADRERWPVLTPEALRLMLYPGDAPSPVEERKRRRRARLHAEAMHADGVIEMVQAGGGWRIYRGPR